MTPQRRRPGKLVKGALAAVVAVVVVVLAVVLLQSRDGAPGEPDERAAENVILLIGDGMGVAQREIGRLSSAGRDGELAMNDLPVAGLVHTSSTAPVTDSAAAATAMATGVKTNNGSVGVDVNGREVRSVLDLAREAGKATGLVTTSSVTDATPAAFGASVPDRFNQSEIARQYVTGSGIDLLLGGGRDYWYPEGGEGADDNAREDDSADGSRSRPGSLVELAEDNGYAYVDSAEGLASADEGKLLGLFADKQMYRPASEGDGDEYAPLVSLADMTRTATRRLSDDPDGFFLVVEEEAIDEFAHENNAERTAEAVAALDEAVRVAMKFAEQSPDTLVIVAADHETGGLGIEEADPDDPEEDGPLESADPAQEFNVDWTTGGHTGEDVPITAAGPGAAAFGGVLDNTEVFRGMVGAMQLRDRAD